MSDTRTPGSASGPTPGSPGKPPARKGPRAAVAMSYDPGQDAAPRIVAAGKGELAEAILALAEKHQVPVFADHPLANALVKLEIGAYVPPELYAAVAEILAFLWNLEREQSRTREEGAQ